MRSPALALMSQVWLRHRLGLAVCGVVWLALAAVALLTPRAAWLRGTEDGPLVPAHFVFLIFSFLPVIAFVVCAFAYNRDGPLEGRESAFPTWTFTRPVRTSTLVAWPMLQAVVAVAATGFAWDWTILRPVGLDLPAWPALLLAAVMAWVQAVNWSPHPLPFLRIGTALLAVGLIGLLPTYGIIWGISPAVWTSLLAALIPAAYCVAVAGVARARRGDTPEWTWPGRLVRVILARLPSGRVPTESPLRAQAWFEWQSRGLGVTIMSGLYVLLCLPPLFMGERVIDNAVTPETTPAFAAAVNTLTPPGLSLLAFLTLFLVMTGMLATELGGTRLVGQRNPASGCHPFLGLRPLTDWEVVLAKLRMAARVTIAIWAMVLLVVAIWLGLTGAWRVLAGAPFLQPYSPLEVLGVATAGLVGLILFAWLRLAAGLWIGLTGRPWLTNTLVILVLVAWLAIVLSGMWLSEHPTVRTAVLAALPSVAVAAVVTKLLLAFGLTRALRRQRLVSEWVLALSAVAWLAMAAGLVVLLRWAFPVEWAALRDLALAVVLLLPLNRLAAAPLALAWNRHR